MKPAFALVVLASPAVADDLYFFQSPSGNIHCMIATGAYAEARCDAMHLTPSYTRPPAGCDLDWGRSFAIGLYDRRGVLACVGDTVAMPGSDVLPYGEVVQLGGFDCVSEQSGMTCTNPTGHGFTLSKARQRVFQAA